MEYNPTIAHEQLSRFGLTANPATFSINPQYAFQAPRISAVPPQAVSSPSSSTSSLSDQEETSDNDSTNPDSSKKRQRGNYKCSKCGQPKKGHSCPFFPTEGSSPTDPSTPETEHSVGSGQMGSHSAPSSTQSLLGMVSPSSLEENQLFQRIRELEHENYMIHNENAQLRERLIGLGYGNHLAQLQNHFQQNYNSNVQQYQRPQMHGVPVGVGLGVPVSYESSEWDYSGALKKRRANETREGY